MFDLVNRWSIRPGLLPGSILAVIAGIALLPHTEGVALYCAGAALLLIDAAWQQAAIERRLRARERRQARDGLRRALERWAERRR